MEKRPDFMKVIMVLCFAAVAVIFVSKQSKPKREKNNYEIISVKKEISYESTIYRYENNLELGMVPRATAKEDHDNVVDAICDNLDIIYEQNAFDDIKLFDREGNNLYTAKCGVAPSLVEKDKLFGYWSDSEITSYRKIIDDIIALKRSRNASDLAKYILESSIKFAYAKSRIEKLNK